MFINLLPKHAISLCVARGTIAFEPKRCVMSQLGQAELDSHLYAIAHYYIIEYSYTMLIRPNLY